MSDFNPYQSPDAEVVAAQASELEVHEGVRRPVSHAIQWLGDGWTIFMRHWLLWCAALFIYLLITSAASLVPILGFFLQMLLTPVFTAGLLFMARKVDNGQPLSVGDLFQGFQDAPGKLMLLGLVLALLVVVAVVLTVLAAIPLLGSDLGAMQQAMVAAESGQLPSVAVGGMIGLKVALLVCIYFLLIIPVMAAYWFALPLVYFGEVSIGSALIHSLVVCMRNFFSLFVYGLLLLVLMVGLIALLGVFSGLLALVSEGLGVAVAVVLVFLWMFALMGIMMTSWYASFRDIFLTPE